MGERVEAELEALLRGALRLVAALLDRRRLVVDDGRALGAGIDAIPPTDDAVATEHERKPLLDQLRRRLALLLFIEPLERIEPGLESLGLVLRADEALGQPRRAEGRLEIGERRLLALTLAAQVVLDRLVKGEAVGHL